MAAEQGLCDDGGILGREDGNLKIGLDPTGPAALENGRNAAGKRHVRELCLSRLEQLVLGNDQSRAEGFRRRGSRLVDRRQLLAQGLDRLSVARELNGFPVLLASRDERVRSQHAVDRSVECLAVA